MLELLIFILGIMAGYLIREIIFLRDYLRISKKLQHEVQTSKNKSNLEFSQTNLFETVSIEVHRLKHEIYNNVHYFYELETDNFVCQGSTLEECAKNFALARGDLTLALFKNATTERMEYFRNGTHSNATIVQ